MPRPSFSARYQSSTCLRDVPTCAAKCGSILGKRPTRPLREASATHVSRIEKGRPVCGITTNYDSCRLRYASRYRSRRGASQRTSSVPVATNNERPLALEREWAFQSRPGSRVFGATSQDSRARGLRFGRFAFQFHQKGLESSLYLQGTITKCFTERPRRRPRVL